MKIAAKIKAGDKKLLINGSPPRVDCRVVAEDNYQEILQTFQKIKEWDISEYVNGNERLLPYPIRKVIFNFLRQHGL